VRNARSGESAILPRCRSLPRELYSAGRPRMYAPAKPSLYLLLAALLAALSAAPVYAIACPIVCELSAGSRVRAPMPAHEMACCHSRRCPMRDSNRKSSSNHPCGSAGSNCVNHSSAFGFVIPSTVTVHPQILPAHAQAARAWRSHDLAHGRVDRPPSLRGSPGAQATSPLASILRI
jgi:hypothetical protein